MRRASWLPVTTIVVMVNVEEEDVVVGKVDENGIEPISAAKKAYKVLKGVMKFVRLVDNALVLGLVEDVEQFCNDMFECVQAVMYNTLCNTFWIAEL